MIVGIGSDLVEVRRIAGVLERRGNRFLNRVFTEREIQLGSLHKNPAVFYAGRWAVKEAISKALGTGIGELLSWHDLEIAPDSLGKPIVNLSSKAKGFFHNPKLHVSITHTGDLAMAFAVWEK